MVTTVDALKTAIEKGGEIILGADVTLTETIAISGNVTLNLNGNSLDASSIEGRPFDMQDSSSLTINGGTSVVKVGKYGLVNIPIGNTASITLNEGVYQGETDNGAFIKVRGSEYQEETNDVNIVLKGVKYTDASTDGYILNTNEFDGTCKVTVDGGTYSAGGGFQGMTTGSSVTGATITSTSAVTSPAMFAVEFEGGNSSIENCTVDAKYIAISAGFEGTVTVNNCTVASDTYAYAIFPTGGNINVTGGSYVGDLYIYELNDGAPASKITIEGEVLAESN
jgi:hypothetical protein